MIKTLLITLSIILLSSSFHLNAQTSPLNSAARSQNHQLVAELLASGADPNETNQFGSTALSGVSGMCDENDVQSLYISRLLLDHGADINFANEEGITPIANAAAMGCDSNVYYLLQRGADLNLRSSNGTTTLMFAVQSGDESTVKLLLDAGANPKIKARSGYDAFYIADLYGHSSLEKLLASYIYKNGQNFVYEYVDCKEQNFDGLIGTNGLIKKCFEKHKNVESIYDYDLSSSLDKEDLASNNIGSVQSTDNYNFDSRAFLSKELLSSGNLLMSFLITWTIILTPVVLLRLFSKDPLSKLEAFFFVFILFFINHIIFAALESQSRSHAALSIGAMLSYIILRMRIKKDLAESASEASALPNQGWGKKTISSPAAQANETRRKPLSKNKKLLISFSVFWLVWVSVRTFCSFEFLGFDFYEWDEDAYFLNLLVPPSLLVMIYSIFAWVKSDRSLEDDD